MAAAQGSDGAQRPKPRGRAQVEQRLVEVAADLLAEVGPRQLSMRAVSSRAGVNVAQAYHYFGSKEALLVAAMRALAREWYDEVAPSVGRMAHPSPIPLGGYPRYWRALVHAILDKEYELAELEFREEISVARTVIASIAEEFGGELDVEQRITLAAAFSLSLGWVAFEHFMLELVGLPDDHATVVAGRQQIEDMTREWMRRLGEPRRKR